MIQSSLSCNKKLASGLSTRRVQYIHAVLRAALNAAVKDGIISRNAAALVKPTRVPSSASRARVHLTEPKTRRSRRAVANAMDAILNPVAVNETDES
jgi:hypothetical protein